MRKKNSRRRGTPHANPKPACAICGQLVSSNFGFDVHDDGRMIVHPDCFMYEHSGELTRDRQKTDPTVEYVPSRVLPPGKRPLHTCGDPTCVNPRHLADPGV